MGLVNRFSRTGVFALLCAGALIVHPVAAETAKSEAAVAAAQGTDAPAVAASPDPVVLLDDILIDEIRSWAYTPTVVAALMDRNRRSTTMTPADILDLDERWRDEVTVADQPLITSVLASPLSQYVLQVQAGSGGLIHEITAFDALGLSVAQTAISLDMYKGDEDVWVDTVATGAHAVHRGPAEWDDVFAVWTGALALSVPDESGKVVGGMLVRVNLTELVRRRAAGV